MDHKTKDFPQLQHTEQEHAPVTLVPLAEGIVDASTGYISNEKQKSRLLHNLTLRPEKDQTSVEKTTESEAKHKVATFEQ